MKQTEQYAGEHNTTETKNALESPLNIPSEEKFFTYRGRQCDDKHKKQKFGHGMRREQPLDHAPSTSLFTWKLVCNALVINDPIGISMIVPATANTISSAGAPLRRTYREHTGRMPPPDKENDREQQHGIFRKYQRPTYGGDKQIERGRNQRMQYPPVIQEICRLFRSTSIPPMRNII